MGVEVNTMVGVGPLVGPALSVAVSGSEWYGSSARNLYPNLPTACQCLVAIKLVIQLSKLLATTRGTIPTKICLAQWERELSRK